MARVDFRKVNSNGDLEEVFRLRYKVYCEEWGFEKKEDYPDEIERDAYDPHSTHFAAVREGQIIGTVRLIHDAGQGLPIEQHTRIDEDLSNLERDKVAEISRLAVSKRFRKRASDGLLYSRQVKNPLPPALFARKTGGNEKRRTDLVTGLYISMYVESKLQGVEHWYAVIARGLYLLLARYGVVFSQIGPEVEYHGLRAPYLAHIPELERQLSITNPELKEQFDLALAKAKGEAS